jgi:hypothetical protein
MGSCMWWRRRPQRLRVTRNIYMGVIEHGGMRYAYIELPSGRKMYYADPVLESSPRGPVVRFFGRDPIRKVWGHVRAYGGMLCGHATQVHSSGDHRRCGAATQ